MSSKDFPNTATAATLGIFNAERFIDIRRRYKRGVANLVDLYLAIVDTASVFQGSGFKIDIEKDKIIEKSNGKIMILQTDVWNDLLKISKTNL